MEISKRKAVILSDCGVISEILTYEDVWKFRDAITDFIAKNIKDKHLCIGLRMGHNIFIPSLVLSLQELDYAFIFLPERESEFEQIIQHLGIPWVLTFRKVQNNELVLDLNNHTLCLEKHANIHSKTYENIYYIIRTSGTTGTQKIVKVRKHCIESNIASLSKNFNITSSDTVYFGTPLTFDPSMVELLLALHNNACLLITNRRNQLNFTLLYKTLFHSDNGISVLQIVPSLFMRWSHRQISSILLNSALKILAFGGEPFPISILQYQKSQTLRMFNLYGITEVSCWASVHEISSTDEEVPIGVPLDNTVIEIRTDDEIYIGSDSRICLIDEEVALQGLVFRATGDIGETKNGNFFYKGRKNDVFKRWGHKLHLSKIEELVTRETGLENKCIWSNTGSKLLLFFIDDQYDNTKDKVIDKVRIKLLHSLPSHCFPDYIDIIRKCPITGHGKVDKKALELIYLNRDKDDKDRTDIFKSLVCKYFGVGQCQWDELSKSTFFDLGGTSILAVQFMNEFEDSLGIECPSNLLTALLESDLGTCFECLKNVQVSRKRNQIRDDSNVAKKNKKREIELRVTWTYDLHACVDSSPLVFNNGNRTFVAVGSFSHIFAVLDATTGEEICKFVLPDVIESPPCLSPCQNYLYVGCFDGKIYCLDWGSKIVKWTYSTGDRIKCRPVHCLKSSCIVFGSYDKYVHCVNNDLGTPFWKSFVSESVISTPVVSQGKIFVATICGTCLCLDEATGEVLWRCRSGSPIFGAPCIYKNSVVWPCVRGEIVSVTFDGKIQWRYECGGHLYSSLLVYQDFVIFGCHDQNLYILEDGKSAKIVHLEDKISGRPCMGEIKERCVIVVVSDSGCVNLVDFGGVVVGELRLSNQVFSSPTVWENRIYVGCRDNCLYCIECCEEKNVELC